MMPEASRPGPLLTLPFEIPAYWTPEQAQAVLELLDDLRERIAAHYQLCLIELYRQQHTPGDAHSGGVDGDPPF
jgi:hypothetical protein